MWAFKSRDFTLLLLKCSRVSLLLVLKATVLYPSSLIAPAAHAPFSPIRAFLLLFLHSRMNAGVLPSPHPHLLAVVEAGGPSTLLEDTTLLSSFLPSTSSSHSERTSAPIRLQAWPEPPSNLGALRPWEAWGLLPAEGPDSRSFPDYFTNERMREKRTRLKS